MKTLAEIEDDAQKNPEKKDFLLLFNGRVEKCTWLDPFLGLFQFDRIPDKACMTNDFDKFTRIGTNP